jgi:predicted nucleic acid-binding protein
MGLSCLTESAAAIVIDTSAAINLSASGCGAAILKALPNRALIADVVVDELEGGRRTGRRDSELIAELSKGGLLEIAHMNEEQERFFESLVIGGAMDTLDDGEAATIAVALGGRAIAIVDERKASRICAQRHPELQIGCTIDLFAHNEVQGALGTAALCDAVFSALRHARMRVPSRYIEWVVGLIGRDRVGQCPSLPRAVRVRQSMADVR